MTLEVRSLTKAYGHKLAVHDLTFTVPEGTVFGLLGLNGAGKSTTIRMILDILTPDEGEVLWRGRPARDSVRKHFGYLPEERGLYPKMKVMDHLVLFGRLHGFSRTEAMRVSAQWLERFEIAHYSHHLVSDLSKGNQQKVQFIAALLHDPDLVILDEPFSGLDPVNASMFKEVFRELVKGGRTIIFSSHQLAHVEELSDAIGIIHDARMVLQGDVEDILSQQPPRQIRLRANRDEVLRVIGHDVPVESQRGYLCVPISACHPQKLLRRLLEAGVEVGHFELVRSTLNDVFLEKVGKSA
jgi:ABC-2 type transport system ATP-binding protein